MLQQFRFELEGYYWDARLWLGDMLAELAVRLNPALEADE